MRKICTVLIAVMCLMMCVSGAEGTEDFMAGEDEIRLDGIKQAREAVWNEYCLSHLGSEELKSETEAQALVFGEVTMRYTVEVKGKMPENGYPLYIALHGGGASDTPDINDQQWGHMQAYYSDWLDCGVYVAVRGVRDTWDTHFNPESYPLYDRLIEYMILTQNVDPNRVYLEGFSAGGDGVYAISPRMADRFAAVNMSSGHPNGVSLVNLYNLPIQLQAGEFDTAYDRNTVTAQYGVYLDELQAAEPEGYAHRVLIHLNKGHNYPDYEATKQYIIENYADWLNGSDALKYARIDCFPPHYMRDFVRNPLPERVIWDLNTRAEMRKTESFYYLSAPIGAEGTLRVELAGDNRIEIDASEFEGDFDIYLNEDMIDFARPVTFALDGREISVEVRPSLEVLKATTLERGDRNYQFEAKVSYSQLLEK
ncbi:MAG: hypothetical protein II920_04690 [Clostridia bacterium]|nr:hypothetical protein [Clostridia bacterium]